MLRTASLVLSLAVITAIQSSAHGQSAGGAPAQPATTTAPANPYTRPAVTAPVVPNPRDQLPFTNESLTNLNPQLPTLFIAGDSTAANGNATTRGWAALLVDYFDTSKVNLVNRAQGGARFNGYMTQNWPAIIAALKPGDFVVIEFGHNSGPLPGIGEETQPAPPSPGRGRRGVPAPASAPATATAAGPAALIHTHGWYLRQFINDVRAKKAIPIASTLTLRDLWKDGKIERLKELTVGAGSGMSDWTRQVAAAEKVALVDHSNIIGDIYDKLGETEADKLFGDHYLHTNTAGAIINCEAFISGLKALPDMPLISALNDKGKAIPAFKSQLR